MFLTTNLQILGVGTDHPFDLSLWNVADYMIDGFDEEDDNSLHLLQAHLYFRALKHVPFLARLWFSNCKSRQFSIAVESYTEKHFSPVLIKSEMTFAAENEIEDLGVKFNLTTRELNAVLEFEESELDILVKLPHCFPLKLAEISSGTAGGRQAGINEARWRAWLLSISSVMVGLNGTVYDALSLFKKNVTLHFEGIEDCAICYAVISAADRSTPQKRCKTCNHMFHGSCLFKVIFLNLVVQILKRKSMSIMPTAILIRLI
jgi:hypothetical protein